ncbi:MAG: pilus assembly protein PilM [Deltaproteobacteria bacterium]|nr:pilus assembly protein PilM [Deltaproteobacteria bacterium]
MAGLISLRRARTWFAVDVGSSSIKIAEVTEARDGPRVLRTGVLPVPAGAAENGFVRRTDVLGHAIREFAGPPPGKPRRAVVSIPGRGVIIKRLRIREPNLGKLDDVIEFEAMDALPEDPNNVNIDYHVLGPSEEGGGLEVLLVAGRKSLVENYVDLVEAAGLVPAIAEVDHFALRSGSSLGVDGPADALVHTGACSTIIHVPADEAPGYTRELPVGGEQFTESLAANLGVSRDEAEAVKLGRPSAEAAGLVNALCEEFAANVSRGLALVGTLSAGTGPRQVSLSGGGALLPGLAPSLARALEAEVRVSGPFFGPHLSPDELHTGPAFAVVAGLVTRNPFE